MTSQRVLFIKSSDNDYRILYEINYQELKKMDLIEEEGKVYLVAYLEDDNSQKRSLRFKLESRQIATSLAKKIRYAKENFDETHFILLNYKAEEDD